MGVRLHGSDAKNARSCICSMHASTDRPSSPDRRPNQPRRTRGLQLQQRQTLPAPLQRHQLHRHAPERQQQLRFAAAEREGAGEEGEEELYARMEGEQRTGGPVGARCVAWVGLGGTHGGGARCVC